MPTTLLTGCWLLAFGASAAWLPTPLTECRAPAGQASVQTLPVNPFPRANSVWLQTADPVPVAMDRLVRYYQAQGYVVDTVDREGFFTVRAHTTLPLPQRPVRLDVQASFGSLVASPGGLPATVRLRATYATGPLRRMRPLPVYYQPALRPAPARQVRYTTFLAPVQRAAFLELQRVSREAFPGAMLTYGNEVH